METWKEELSWAYNCNINIDICAKEITYPPFNASNFIAVHLSLLWNHEYKRMEWNAHPIVETSLGGHLLKWNYLSLFTNTVVVQYCQSLFCNQEIHLYATCRSLEKLSILMSYDCQYLWAPNCFIFHALAIGQPAHTLEVSCWLQKDYLSYLILTSDQLWSLNLPVSLLARTNVTCYAIQNKLFKNCQWI